MRKTIETILVLAVLVAGPAGCHESHTRGDATMDTDTDGSTTHPHCTGDPSTDTVLDQVLWVATAPDGWTEVALADGYTYLLRPEDELYADIIDSHRERGLPIYLEYEIATTIVVDVDLPQEYTVLTIVEEEDAARMTFDVSHAIHPMDRALPCYDLFLETLKAALDDGTTVWVTHDTLYWIIDVRPAS